MFRKLRFRLFFTPTENVKKIPLEQHLLEPLIEKAERFCSALLFFTRSRPYTINFVLKKKMNTTLTS